eukprot:TRINITY_DN12582_c1_g1_i10.p2 TRINITY_DN12582_c1_g1~~TRINITY_DN12582_c1_g1_i10.p2  ORF type:complete len:217 (+),score=69.31 TRINITY_DN12582_c1_g1_i10:2359-3009(+)
MLSAMLMVVVREAVRLIIMYVGNLGDVVSEHVLSTATPMATIDPGLLQQAAKMALQLMKDKDKIVSNAVRALAGLVYSLDANEDGELLNNIGKSLAKATKSGPAKVRWNACRALGNYMAALDQAACMQASQEHAVLELLNVLTSSSNYKVRIAASAALTAVRNASARLHLAQPVLQAVFPIYASFGTGKDAAEFDYLTTLKLRVSLQHDKVNEQTL